MKDEAKNESSTESPRATKREPAVAVVRTVEAWANDKGHLPQPFGQAKMLNGWITGSEVTEQDYDAAITAISQLRFG